MTWLGWDALLAASMVMTLTACAGTTPPPVDPTAHATAPVAPPPPECGGRPLACRQVEQRYLDLGGAAPDVARRLEPECAHDLPGACAALGAFLLRGAGVPRDDARAFHLLDGKCTAGDDASCGWLGIAYQEGRGVTKDDKRAGSLYAQACQKGHEQACVARGAMQEERSPGDAAEAYDQACRHGEPLGCLALARTYAHAIGSPRDLARGLAMYTTVCEGGVLHACVLFGEELRVASGDVRDEARARALFQRACDAGDAMGCSDLGEMVLSGRGGAADQAAGQALADRACNDHTPEGCSALGRMYRLGIGVTPDYARARGHLRRACEAGSGAACCQLAKTIQFGRGQATAFNEGFALYRRACTLGSACGCEVEDTAARTTILDAECDGGDAWECTHLGDALSTGSSGATLDLQRAAEHYRRGCDLEDGHACQGLGELLRGGRGVAQDTARSNALYARAAPFLRRVCDAGDARACMNLGEQLTDGMGIPADKELAAALYRRSCDEGDLGGCNDLGRLLNQKGPKRDVTRAIELFNRACTGTDDAELPIACWNLGRIYASGDGVPRDDTAAFRMFERSCNASENRGCLDLANAYERGQGVAADPGRAASVREQACKRGVFGACTADNPRTVTAVVKAARGAPGVGVGSRCTVRLAGLALAPGQCRLHIECGKKTLYGGPHNYISCSVGAGAPHDIHATDPDPSSVDGDPMLDFDTSQHVARVRDEARPPQGELDVTLTLPTLP